MPLSNFKRPPIPYDNEPLPNDNRFNIITRVLKKPITDEQLDGEFNSCVDRDNELDQKIEAVEAGIITGSDNPLNAGKFLTTDGAETPTLSFVNVTNANIDDGAISGAKITPLSIGTNQLDNGVVTPDKIPNASIPYSKMDFQAGDIPYAVINVPDGSITYEKLNIADGSITYAKLNIPDNTLPGSKIVNKSITQAQQGLLSVGTGELIDQSVTLGKIAPGVLTVAAVKADQIAANSTTVYTNPSVQQHHPSAVKFWCVFDGTLIGTNPPLVGYNVVSVTRNSVGQYTVNYIVPFSTINYCVNITLSSTGFPLSIVNLTSKLTNSFSFHTYSASGTLQDALSLNVSGLGTQ
jgi:hypothetical protein